MRAVIRLRSDINAHREIRETLMHLRLNRVNHCVLVPDGKTYDGMLQKVKDYVTWGKINSDVLANLIIKRGRLAGERPITNLYIKVNTGYDSLIKFAQDIAKDGYRFSDLKDVKPVFRLHPPRKGFEGVKRSFRDKGALGYRGDAINDLILKMLAPPMKKKEVAATAKPEVRKPAAPSKTGKAAAPKKAKPAGTKPKPKTPAKKKPAPAKKKPAGKKSAKEESE